MFFGSSPNGEIEDRDVMEIIFDKLFYLNAKVAKVFRKVHKDLRKLSLKKEVIVIKFKLSPRLFRLLDILFVIVHP